MNKTLEFVATREDVDAYKERIAELEQQRAVLLDAVEVEYQLVESARAERDELADLLRREAEDNQ